MRSIILFFTFIVMRLRLFCAFCLLLLILLNAFMTFCLYFCALYWFLRYLCAAFSFSFNLLLNLLMLLVWNVKFLVRIACCLWWVMHIPFNNTIIFNKGACKYLINFSFLSFFDTDIHFDFHGNSWLFLLLFNRSSCRSWYCIRIRVNMLLASHRFRICLISVLS